MVQDPPLLVVDGASKSYGGARALCGVSLRVHAGDITGIVGESGSGKTTLARIMAGLLRPSGGTVSFAGTNLGTLAGPAARRIRRDLQYVHQDPSAALDPRFRVRSILHEPLKIHTTFRRGARDARIASVLDAVGLDPALMDRFPHQISGGQQRRVGLARVLVLQPRLIILDEPTAGLDLIVKASVLALLRELQTRLALTYVVVTHDLAVVEALCTDVVTLYRGSVVESGPVSAVLGNPVHPYTQELLAAMPVLDGPRIITQTRWQTSAADDPPLTESCPFHHRCGYVLPRCGQEMPVLAQRQGRAVACWAVRQPNGALV